MDDYLVVGRKPGGNGLVHLAEGKTSDVANIESYYVRCGGWSSKKTWIRVNKKTHVPTCLWCVANMRDGFVMFDMDLENVPMMRLAFDK